MGNEPTRVFKVTLDFTLVVTDLPSLEAWVGEHVELLSDITYSEEWVDPTDPESEPAQPAYISDVSAYLPADPESMLMLAAQCLMVLLPGVEVEDTDWGVE